MNRYQTRAACLQAFVVDPTVQSDPMQDVLDRCDACVRGGGVFVTEPVGSRIEVRCEKAPMSAQKRRSWVALGVASVAGALAGGYVAGRMNVSPLAGRLGGGVLGALVVSSLWA